MVKDSRNNADSDISIDIEDGNYGSAVGKNYGTVNNNIYQTEKQHIEDTHELTIPPFILEKHNHIETNKELEDIKKLFFKDDNQLLLLNGYGGMGKTTLASYYYHTYQKLYKNVGWVFNDKGICDALLKLSIALKVEYEDSMQKEERLEKLLRAMAKLDKPCLLIIDNVDDLKELRDNYQYLSRCSNFHILITTRVSEFNFVNIYRIDGLGEEKARELFQKYYKIENDNENLELFQKLYRAVGGNTLVIELIAKNLYWLNRYNTYTLSSLLDDLQKKGLLDIKNSQNVSSTYHTDCVVTKEPKAVIEGIYDLNELQVNEVLLLSVLSVLPAESIEYEILQSLIGSREDICENLDLLSQKGWIEYNQESKSVQCNPLIQEITRQKREDTLFDDCRELIASLIYMLEYEPGTGHCINTTYQKAAIYAVYAECTAQFFPNTGGSFTILFERLGNYYSTVGNSLKALELFEEDTKLTKELYEGDPTNVSFKNGLAILYEKLGETHTTLGNLKKALELFENGTELFQELYKAAPNNVSFKNGLAISYSKLGETHTTLGNLEKALELFENETELFQELYKAAPNNVSFKNGLAVSYSKLGETHTTLGNLKKALELFENETELFKELYKAAPNDVSFKNGLAVSYEKLGETHTTLGNLKKALELFENETELFKELYEADPNNVSFKNGLAISYSKLGATHTALGNLKKALELFEKDNKLKKELYEADPNNVSIKNGLAISYEKLGATHTTLGNLKKALELFEEDTKLIKELYEIDPNNVSFKNGLAISYSKLGETHTTLGNLKKALELFEDETELFKELYEADPNNVSIKNGLAISYEKLGATHTTLGNLKKALELFEDGTELFKELYEADPNNVSIKNGLAISYAKLGMFFRNSSKDEKMAHTYFLKAEELWVELVRDAPDYIEFSRYLERVREGLKSVGDNSFKSRLINFGHTLFK